MDTDGVGDLFAALARSPFYVAKTAGRIASIQLMPFTNKSELMADQQVHPPYGSNLTEPRHHYTRLNQTSGTTTGKPLRWLDTPASWSWLLDRWDLIYGLAGIRPDDRLCFAFSFGPFLGFWTAFEAAARKGWAVFPVGGMSSLARLQFLKEHDITIVLCTPTYALHLAEIAVREKSRLENLSVRALVVAGEPGGLIPTVRNRIESAWGARVIDHYGLTEVGPVAVEPVDAPGALSIVDGYLAEVIDPVSTQPVSDGEIGELVLTNLGRLSSPLVRYRTGDLVRGETTANGLRLVGGILGRADDMIHIRGNNVYPSAIESIVRRFPSIFEFRVTLDDSQPLSELAIEIESHSDENGTQLARQVEQAVRDELLFRPTVISVSPGTLPRFEMKAKRFYRRGRGGH